MNTIYSINLLIVLLFYFYFLHFFLFPPSLIHLWEPINSEPKAIREDFEPQLNCLYNFALVTF